MKIALFSLALVTTATFAFAAAEVGKPAPDFTGTDINGKTYKLSDYKGRIVVLESYNQDCPFCHNQYRSGAMQDLQKDLTSKSVIFFVVDSAGQDTPSYRSPERARKEWEQQKMHATAWLDDHSGDIGR